MTKNLTTRENENLNLIMNLLKQTKYWERLSKLPQVRCGHLYTLINERIDLETEKGDEILSNRNARYKNGAIKYKWEDIKLRLIEITKDDMDFQTLMLCYNIIWTFDHKLGHDFLGNYDV